MRAKINPGGGGGDDDDDDDDDGQQPLFTQLFLGSCIVFLRFVEKLRISKRKHTSYGD